MRARFARFWHVGLRLQRRGAATGRSAEGVERLPRNEAVGVRAAVLLVQRRTAVDLVRVEGRSQGAASPQEVLRRHR